MRVLVKWFTTGNVSTFEEADELLGPQTTIAEVKGLIQIRFGFPVNETILIHNGKLAENAATLRSLGITGSGDEARLTAHVVRRTAKLGKARDLDAAAAPAPAPPVGVAAAAIDSEDDDEDDSVGSIHEFDHESMALALRMLGRDVPVPVERLAEVRRAPPRARPAFLGAEPHAKDNGHGVVILPASAPSASSGAAAGAPAAAAPAAAPEPQTPRCAAEMILADMRHGLRREGADEAFAIRLPGVAEPYQYWDMRLVEAEARHKAQAAVRAAAAAASSEGRPAPAAVELFFFGEFAPVATSERVDGDGGFRALVRQLLARFNLRAQTPLPPREAGCMYPLVAVVVLLSPAELHELGTLVFDEFGTAKPSAAAAAAHTAGASDPAVAGKATGCAQQ